MIVEGRAEFAALPEIYPALSSEIDCVLLGPAFAPAHPTAPPNVIARACRGAIKVLEQKRADHIVVLLDLEDCPSCAGERAQLIERELSQLTGLRVSVVLKHRAFENWLIADVEAVRAISGRFVISKAAERKVSPNKADHVDGYAWLSAASGRRYEKVDDARRILSRSSVGRIASNSRSFRRFMRVLDHPAYQLQSARPA